MEKIRGFEVAKGFEDKKINLPERKTKYSAGYDIEAAEDVIIPSFKKGINPTLVKTGIKVYMPDDEVVLLYNRSSNPKKKGLIMANSVGVIDKDYYGNPDNDGHIMFAFYNIKEEDITTSFIMETFGEFDGIARFNPYDIITIPPKSYGKGNQKEKEWVDLVQQENKKNKIKKIK